MKLYESYVAEARARRRRRFAVGIVGAIMLATIAVAALMVFNTPVAVRPAITDCAEGVPVPTAACDRASLRSAG